MSIPHILWQRVSLGSDCTQCDACPKGTWDWDKYGSSVRSGKVFLKKYTKQAYSRRQSFSIKRGSLVGTIRNLLHPLDKYPRTTMRQQEGKRSNNIFQPHRLFLRGSVQILNPTPKTAYIPETRLLQRLGLHNTKCTACKAVVYFWHCSRIW